MTGWKKKEGQAVTKKEIPAGAEVRVKVVKKGTEMTDLCFNEFVGASNLISRKKQCIGKPIKDGVYKFIVPKNMKVSISFGGGNYQHKVTDIDGRNGIHEVTFQKGWAIQVKVIGGEF